MLLKEDKQKNALVMPRTYFFPQLQVQKKTHHQKTTTKTTNTTYSEKKRQSTTHRDKKPHENQQTQ